MYGVTFGDKHSYHDFGLVMTDYEITEPEPQLYTVEVPGRNGLLNLTGSICKTPAFGNRQLRFAFVWKERPECFEETVAKIVGYLHGKRMQVILDSDPDFYYEGQTQISSRIFSGTMRADIEVIVNAQPFKLRTRETIHKLSGSGRINCRNDRMGVTPLIRVTKETTIVMRDVSVTLDPGEFLVENMKLQEGNNFMQITGTGTTEIRYRQGRL